MRSENVVRRRSLEFYILRTKLDGIIGKNISLTLGRSFQISPDFDIDSKSYNKGANHQRDIPGLRRPGPRTSHLEHQLTDLRVNLQIRRRKEGPSSLSTAAVDDSKSIVCTFTEYSTRHNYNICSPATSRDLV